VRERLAREQVWRAWDPPFLGCVRHSADSIRAIALVSDDWQRDTHGQCRVDAAGARVVGCNEGTWANTRLDVSPALRARGRAELRPDGRYLLPAAPAAVPSR
jgi:hypothetical protein